MSEDVESAGLRLLLEERAILRTLYRYCHAMDYDLEDEWVGLFTDDGVFDVTRPSGERLHREEGRSQLAAYVAQYPRPPQRYNKHVLVNPLIEVHGDTADVRSYFLFLTRGEQGEARITSYGHYRDRLAKVDAEWRFVERRAEVEARPPNISGVAALVDAQTAGFGRG